MTLPETRVLAARSRLIDDARRFLRDAAANPDEQAALRSLLKEIRALLDLEDDEDEELDDEEEKATGDIEIRRR